MSATCPECRYLQEERAAIHEFDGKASRWEAERLAKGERCEAHRELGVGRSQMGMKIEVVKWEKHCPQAGEYVGAPRTLAGPFRFGFDGSMEVVLFKYRDWLGGQVREGGPVREKLRDLLRQARTKEGLRLVCLNVEIGEEIKRVLEEMNLTTDEHGGTRMPENGAAA
jgi:hypothetical protein